MHRPRYDDWSFPKGKLDRGEGWEDAALREVQEEIGLRCRLGHELPPTSYRDSKGREKVVRYWMMEPLDGEFVPHDEVDEMRWVAGRRRRRPAQLRARPRAAARGHRVNRDRFPGPARRLGAARRAGRHADGRRARSRRWPTGCAPATTPTTAGCSRPRDTPTSWSRATRARVGTLLGGDPRGVAFGPSMTAMTMRFSAAAGRALVPGDEIVCTRLDHDANVRPWLIAAERAGARRALRRARCRRRSSCPPPPSRPC